MTRHTSLSALLRLTAAAAAAFVLQAAHAETPTLRIGWVYAMANAPALIAERKGYFAEEGLKVELKQFGDGPVVQQALSAGELDMAYIDRWSLWLDMKIIARTFGAVVRGNGW